MMIKQRDEGMMINGQYVVSLEQFSVRQIISNRPGEFMQVN